jgi:ammonium transporter, Amt family
MKPDAGVMVPSPAIAPEMTPSTEGLPRLGYDDSLDVFGVHGVGGVLGTLCAGIFAVGAISATADAPGGSAGLLDGNPRQVLIQLLGIAVTVVWCGVATFASLKLTELFVPLRVSDEAERVGLDVALHGESVK